jgi:hypothetical protein
MDADKINHKPAIRSGYTGIGSTRSRANSAAWAIAAGVCSGLRKGVLIEYAFWRLAGRDVVQNDRYRDTRSV